MQVKGKVNALTIDECSKVGVVFENLVASCEVVNSTGVQVQVTGLVPTIIVDKCDGVQVSIFPCPISVALPKESTLFRLYHGF